MTESSNKKSAGRPNKPVEERLTRKVTVAFTEQEFTDLQWTVANQPAPEGKPSPKTDKAVAHFIRRLVLPEVNRFISVARPALSDEEAGV